jgi:hypothetical protein
VTPTTTIQAACAMDVCAFKTSTKTTTIKG